jgi:hypothetical protein
MRPSFLPLCLGLAVGLVLGALLFGSTDADPTSRKPEAAVGPVEQGSLESLTDQREEPPGNSTRTVPEKLEGPGAAIDRARADLAASRVDPLGVAAERRGSIEGRVVTRSGKPLAGVRVRAVPQESRSGRLQGPRRSWVAEGDLDLEETLARAAEAWAREQHDIVRATSGADGRFVLEGVHGSALYRTFGEKDGWRIASAAGQAYFRAGMHTQLIGEPLLGAEVRLVDASGQPLGRGAVAIGDEHSSYLVDWSASDPVIELASDERRIRGVAQLLDLPGHGPGIAAGLQSEWLELGPEDREGPVTLVVEPRGTLWAEVQDFHLGGEEFFAYVCVVPWTGPLEQAPLSTRAPSAVFTSTGSVVFGGLEPGRYAVGLFERDNHELTRTTVDVGAELVHLPLSLPGPDSEDRLAVRVLDPEGAPLSDVRFEYCWMRSGARVNNVANAYRGEGALHYPTLIDTYYERWTALTEFWLFAYHDEYGVVWTPLSEGQRESTLQFAPPAEVRVKVTPPTGAPFAGPFEANLSGPQLDVPSQPRAASRLQIQRAGTTVRRLSPGRYKLAVYPRPAKSAKGRGTPYVQEFELRSGTQDVTIALPPLHTQTVFAPELSPGTRLALQGHGAEGRTGTDYQAVVDESHRATFEFVQPGHYELTAHPAEETLEVTVPGGEVLWEVQQPNAYRVVLSDPSGVLGQAGFEAGDLIIGSADRRILDIYELANLVGGKQPTDFLVRRGTTRRNIVVDLSKTRIVGTEQTLGGSLKLEVLP